jgi:hypothetical protein
MKLSEIIEMMREKTGKSEEEIRRAMITRGIKIDDPDAVHRVTNCEWATNITTKVLTRTLDGTFK